MKREREEEKKRVKGIYRREREKKRPSEYDIMSVCSLHRLST